ncbi:GntP family permease [Limosilactobacillus oris]|uniref:GntP family permease n=1 Tax=Limosilactobacillus oris TaxID=1632 RepID=UPI002235EDE7|nr:Na+/H+ antiporter NhaC family protein [Limosilactobacillus oris]MCW4388029.1 GntP family permease [Limosilactobacillus oris]
MLVSWWGALIGLAIAIILILRKVDAVYSLFIGAIIGSLVGGASLLQTVNILVKGSQSVMGTVVRVLAAGVLAGVMMDSGAANTIARTIVGKMGDRMAILALALATMVITAVGVFIPVAVLIVAPIALEVGERSHISKLALLVALSGGGKAGNIISPNANTIAAAKGFGLNLSQVMIADFIPAVVALIVTVIVASLIKHRGDAVLPADLADNPQIEQEDLPSLGSSLVTPIIAVVLLLINPIGQLLHVHWMSTIDLDATYVLPFAAIIGALAMHKGKRIREYAQTGMVKMTPVVMILIGAGAIGATITESSLPQLLISAIKVSHISGVFLAPLSGILMAGAAASTSTGVILATGSFSKAILGFGVQPLAAAAMVHAGAIVIDQLPQGNYFHVTANAMNMDIKQRSQGILYEAICGGSACLTATVLYGFLHLI